MKALASICALVAPCILLASTLARAQDLPLACREDGVLEPSVENVLHEPNLEFVRGNQERYKFEILSVWAPDPRASSDAVICLRYEIRNLGDEPIEEIRWNDVGLFSGVDAPPNGLPIVRQIDVTSRFPTPITQNTDLKAFENLTKTVRAWFTDAQIYTTSDADQPYKVAYYDARLTASENTLRAFEQVALPIVPVVAFSDFLKPVALDPIRSSVSIGDLRMQAITHAEFNGYEFLLSTKISASALDEVFAPALTSINQWYSASPDETSLYNAVTDLPSLLNKHLSVQESSSTEITFRYKATEFANPPRVYLILHPVTVVTELGSFCVEVSSYSPLPLTVTKDFCNLQALNGMQ